MRKLLLVVIIFIAASLRFWQLGSVPPSPDWDEASLGFNAYSILHTGKDEYGQSFPIILRSFDDYKPALYAYLAIPSIALFGLNTFAVRLPSVIFGLLAVLATYFLVKELFPSGKKFLPEISAFLLSISPWHLQFSRIAFESNVGLTLNILAILFFLKALKKPWFILLSAFCAGLSLHVYQSEKVFVPLIVLALVIIFRKRIFALPKKYIVSALIIGIILILPLIFYLITEKQALLRAKGVSLFADETPFLAQTVNRLVNDKQNNDILGTILDNRRLTYFRGALSGYISHFDLNWMFITGDQPRHHAPNMGLLYLWELPFLLTGFYLLIFGNFDKKVKYLLFAWILIAPIPAAITTGVPHPIRTLNFLPTWYIFIAIGITSVISLMQNIKFRYLFITCYLLLVTLNVFYYLNQYFVQQNLYNSEYWQYGYKQAVDFVNKEAIIEVKYSKIIVSNKPHLDQSYIFFLFYLKYPPAKYQKEARDASGGFRENHAFGKYEFRPIDWEREKQSSEILYVGNPNEFPDGANVIKTINFLDGQPAITIVKR